MPDEKSPVNGDDPDSLKSLENVSESSGEQTFIPGLREYRDIEDPVEKLKEDLTRSVRLEKRNRIIIAVLLSVVILIAAGGYYYLSLEPADRLGLGGEPVSAVRVIEKITTDIPAEETVEESAEESAEEDVGDIMEIMEIEDPFEEIIRADMRKVRSQRMKETVSSVATSDHTGREYAVQVGAFKVERNALMFADKLRNKGYDVSVVVQKFENGQLMYRLLVGRFGSKDRALEELQRLTEKEGLEGFVTTQVDRLKAEDD